MHVDLELVAWILIAIANVVTLIASRKTVQTLKVLADRQRHR